MNKKYINNNSGKGKIRKFTTDKRKVVIHNDSDVRKKYVCQYCGFNTVIRMDDETMYCNHCRGTSRVEDLQEVQQLPEPKTVDNTETLISTIDMPIGPDTVAIHKKPVYRGSFKALSLKGIKITDYTVTDGAGRPIREEEYDE